jgi:hypothetical protein
MSIAYGEIVTLKGIRDALKAIEARKVEAEVNARRRND